MNVWVSHVVKLTHLLDIPQPLKLRCVYNLHQQRMKLNRAVYGILEHLHKHEFEF